jgi:hypothetical protein
LVLDCLGSIPRLLKRTLSPQSGALFFFKKKDKVFDFVCAWTLSFFLKKKGAPQRGAQTSSNRHDFVFDKSMSGADDFVENKVK